jgi:mono/diheme cytochrome c family protein
MTPVQIFRAYCLACHNVDGKGAIVRPAMPDIPDFTQAGWQASRKDEQLSGSILNGGKFMPSMKDKLTAADADAMANFVRAFQDGKQVVKLESRAVPAVNGDKDKPPVVVKEKEKEPMPVKVVPLPTSPELAERLRGAGVLYREYCIACHGSDGAGVAAMRATLPTLPDFTRTSFRDQHSDPQLLVSILDGKGTLMPANRGRLTERQARDLVMFVRAFALVEAGTVANAPDQFQQQFDQLLRQWEALDREFRLLRQAPAKQP